MTEPRASGSARASMSSTHMSRTCRARASYWQTTYVRLTSATGRLITSPTRMRTSWTSTTSTLRYGHIFSSTCHITWLTHASYTSSCMTHLWLVQMYAEFGKQRQVMPPVLRDVLAWIFDTLVYVSKGRIAPYLGDGTTAHDFLLCRTGSRVHM